MTAGSEEELKAKVAEHVRKVHGVQNTSDTIWNYVRQKIRRG